MTEQITDFEISDYLDSPEMIAGYLTESAEAGEQYFFAALGDVAKAMGMSKVARESGLERNGLYKAFSSGASNTQFTTVYKALSAMGLKLEVKPAI